MAIMLGFTMLVIPGIVIAIGWSMAVYVMFEWNKNPMEALRISNELTNGNKWRIFGIFILVSIVCQIIVLICLAIPLLNIILAPCSIIFVIAVYISINAAIWKQLKTNTDIKELSE